MSPQVVILRKRSDPKNLFFSISSLSFILYECSTGALAGVATAERGGSTFFMLGYDFAVMVVVLTRQFRRPRAAL